MPFRILRVGSHPEDYAWDFNADRVWEFETGQEAQAAAKQLSSGGDTKWKVKRVLDTKWRSREQRKFDTGIYTPVPWIDREWWHDRRAVEVHAMHYPHVSRKEPGMIAYTESTDKGMDNKRTWIKPGRYLEKYFSEVLSLYSIKPKTLADAFTRAYEPRKLLFADTEDMVQWVYEHGPDSCMSSHAYRKEHGWGWGSPGDWPEDIHACRTYIAGDLQVAYLTENDELKGRVVARVVVWPEKKTFGRCYGDENRLKGSLVVAGYKFNPPLGAKLQRIPIPGERRFIVPYIDAGSQSGQGALSVKDMKTHLMITTHAAGCYSANSTTGASGPPADRRGMPMEDIPEHCGACGNSPATAGDFNRVHRSGSGGDYVWMCAGCQDDHAFYCDAEERWYSSQHMERIDMGNGVTWSRHAFRSHGFMCDATNRPFHNTRRVDMANGLHWCSEYFEEHGFRCDYTGDAWPNEEQVVLADGHTISKQAFSRHGFTCRDCGQKLLLSARHGKSVPGVEPQCVECHNIQAAAVIANDPANTAQNQRGERRSHD